MSLLNQAPLLPLDTFRQAISFAPYAFWGLAGAEVPINSQCNTAVFEYAYQGSALAGRSEIREALYNAEARLRTLLGFPVAPTYLEETVKYPAYFDQRMTRMTPIDPTGGWVSVQLPDSYVQAVGVESLTLIEETPVTYSDEFNTGVNDTFTLSFATDETDPAKIAIYFAEADRFDDTETSERWRIEPVDIAIDSGTCTVTGRAYLLVKPILYQGFTIARTLDPSIDSNFVLTLAAYTRTTDPNGTTVDDAQGTFIWDSVPSFNWWGWCCAIPNDPAAVAKAIARVGIRNASNGIVIPGEAVYNTDTQEWHQTIPPWYGICHPPVEVTVRYVAGYPLTPQGKMDPRLARAVSYLAMAELPDRICACEAANRALWYYQQDMNRVGNNQAEQFATTRQMLNNPLGNRRGHWYAWNEVQMLRQVRGV